MFKRPGARAVTPNISRALHTTPSVLVKRPQVPFQVFTPPDTYDRGSSNRIKIVRKSDVKRLEFIDNLRTSQTVTAYEKYSDVYGMAKEKVPKSKVRWSTVVQQFRSGVMPGTPGFRPAAKPGKKASSRPREQARTLETQRNEHTAELRERRAASDTRERRPPVRERFTPISNPGRQDVWSRPGPRVLGKPQRPTPTRKPSFGLKGDTARDDSPEPTLAPTGPWTPTKKLTYAAMAAVRELHAQDPRQWTREALSKQYGVSYEAISRILRSKWRESVSRPDGEEEKVSSKWAKSSEVGDRLSPVPVIRKVYDLKRQVEEKK